MIEQIASNIFYFFSHLGLLGAFLVMFFENLAIPLPTQIGYFISQDLIRRGVHSYLMVFFVITIGQVLGAVGSYAIGRWGDRFLLKKFSRSGKFQSVHKKLTKWFARYGLLTIFITRFVGYVRPWSSMVAGFAEVPFWPFLLWTVLGTAIFNVITLYFTEFLLLIWDRFANYQVWIIAAVTFSFLIFFIWEGFVYLRHSKKTKIDQNGR